VAVTVNAAALLGALVPAMVTTTFTRPAATLGTRILIDLSDQLLGVTVVAPNVTVLPFVCVFPKFAPVMVTES
jgi:hypothetical protein